MINNSEHVHGVRQHVAGHIGSALGPSCADQRFEKAAGELSPSSIFHRASPGFCFWKHSTNRNSPLSISSSFVGVTGCLCWWAQRGPASPQSQPCRLVFYMSRILSRWTLTLTYRRIRDWLGARPECMGRGSYSCPCSTQAPSIRPGWAITCPSVMILSHPFHNLNWSRSAYQTPSIV